MSELEYAAGDPEQALRLTNEALELASRGKNQMFRAAYLNNIAAYHVALNDLSGGRESALAGLQASRQVQSGLQITVALQHLALLAGLSGEVQRGAQLLGYVDAQYDRLGAKREGTERWGRDQLLATLRQTLGEDEIKRFATEGAAWSEEHAIDEALKV